MMKVLLALDGSGHSDAATNEVARRLFPAGSEVRVISVVEPPYYLGALSEGGADVDMYEDIENDARKRAGAAVERAATRLRAEAGRPALNITTAVLAGSARRVILDDAEAYGAELIVVGSHGHGKVEGFLLGSVAHSVALHAKCSVEIVRSPPVEKDKSNSP